MNFFREDLFNNYFWKNEFLAKDILKYKTKKLMGGSGLQSSLFPPSLIQSRTRTTCQFGRTDPNSSDHELFGQVLEKVTGLAVPCYNNILRAKCQENQIKQALVRIFFSYNGSRKYATCKICKNVSLSNLSWSQKTKAYGLAKEDQKAGLASFGNAKGRPGSNSKSFNIYIF